jgi:hypothetical protein
MRNVVIGVAVAIVVACFVGYTPPGHRLLKAVGFATACDGGGCS